MIYSISALGQIAPLAERPRAGDALVEGGEWVCKLAGDHELGTTD
jgi:hypothetical protein